MSSSSKGLVLVSDPSLLGESKKNRISISETPTRSPSLVIPRASPVPSVRAEIQNSEADGSHARSSSDEKSPSTIVRAFLPDTAQNARLETGEIAGIIESTTPDVPPASLATSSANASTIALKSPRPVSATPSISAHSISSISAQESRYHPRFSLLNGPNSFLSVTNSSRSSMSSSRVEPDIAEEEANDDMVLAAAQQARLNRPSLIDRDRNLRTAGGGRNFNSPPHTRAKASRVLGEDLQALATEQGGIPVRALASPALSSPPNSAPSRIAPVSQDFNLLPTYGNSQENEVSPGGTPVQHPLRANPTSEALHRSTTLPASTQRTRRPTFLPTPIDPSPGRRFERQSIVSTPYPHSGSTAERHRDSPRERIRASIAQRRPQADSNAEMLTITIHNARRLETQVGLVSIQKNRRAPIPGEKEPKSEPYDDASLACAVLREYRRLRGWPRSIFNARGVVSVRVSYKVQAVESPKNIEKEETKLAPTEEGGLPTDTLTALSAAEEGRGSFVAQDSRKAKSDNIVALARRNVEASLCALLLRPRSGTARTDCLSNLWSLVDSLHANSPLPATGEDEAPSNPIAIELVESWSATNIAYALVIVLILSILAALLWTLIGVGGAAQEVDVNVNVPSHGHIKADTALRMAEGWKAAGARLQAGTSLGILVLLLGWTCVGGWMGGSWLVG